MSKTNIFKQAVIDNFVPNHCNEGEILLVKKTYKTTVKYEKERLRDVVGVDFHFVDNLADIIVYSRKINCLYLIDASKSNGLMTIERIYELEKLLKHSKAFLIFITAFANEKEYQKNYTKLSAEGNVWILENPDDIISLNSVRFCERLNIYSLANRLN